MKRGSHKARHDLRAMMKRAEELDRAALEDRAELLELANLLVEVEREDRE
jgi:hypothetical protein